MTEKTTLEVIAPTIEEALDNGLQQLGLSEDAVEMEILDHGNKGLFGLGTRQARIRLTVKDASDEFLQEVESMESMDLDEVQPAPAKVVDKTEMNSDEELAIEVTEHVVADLLEKMGVKADITSELGVIDEANEHPLIAIEIQGKDLSILIGKRSESLNALQYITSLIVGKELGHWVPISIDVQGYRQRRERQLRQLAHRMADQAVSTGRRQMLEPMPANERRLIHLELRDHAHVITESTGEEPNRKVVILLKE